MKFRLFSFLLAATIAGTVHAAFYVGEDKSPRHVTYSIPFVIGRGQISQISRQALQTLLADARAADTVTVVGHGNSKTNPVLAGQRAIAIKRWLAQNGISADKIEMRDDHSATPADTPSIFYSEVILDQRPTAASSFVRPRPTTLTHETYTPRSVTQIAIVPAQIIPVADQPMIWLLDANKTLRANLEDWAAQAGWKKPDWQIANPYQIISSTTMQGTLLDALGKIAKAVPEIDIQVSRVKREIHVSGGKK